MQTTVNAREDLVHTSRKSQRAAGVCTIRPERVASGGSNVEFGQRSKTVSNEKDKYGFRAMSPFRATYHKRIECRGSSEQRLKGYPCFDTVTDRMTGFPGGMERSFGLMLNRMALPTEQSVGLLAMRAEANLKQQDINLLQFAAFLPSTLRNIKGNLQKMDSLIDILHDKRKLMQRFKGTEWKSLYLQWLFVWNQLHRDLVGGARFLKKQSRPIGSLVTGRSRASSQTTFEDHALPREWEYVGRAVCRSTVEVNQRAVSVARVTCDVAYAHNALGIDNPAYLLWDLVRWSWVVDQIIDIGLFIQSITSLHGLEFLGTSVTRRATNASIVEVEGMTRGNYTFSVDYSAGTSFRKTIDRQVFKNPTRGIMLRNPFQNSVAVTAAVAAAVGLKMQRTDQDLLRDIVRRASA